MARFRCVVRAAVALGLLLGAGPVHPESPDSGALRLTADRDSVPVWPHLEILEDRAATLGPDQVAVKPDAHWAPLERAHQHFGPRSSALWARFTVRNVDGERRRWVIVQEQTFVDDVRLYRREPGGGWRRVTGLRDASADWFGGARNPAFEVTLPAGAPVAFLVRTQTRSLQRFPLVVQSAAHYQRSERMGYMASGVVMAVPLAVAGFVLMLWHAQRQRSLLVITGLIVSEMVGAAWVGGVLHAIAPGVDPAWLGAVGLTSWMLTVALGYLHARIFLDLDSAAPRLARAFRVLPWFLAVFLLFELAGSGIGRNLLIYATFVSLLMFFGASVWQARRGLPYARVYALAWGTYLASVSVIIVNLLGTIPPNVSNLTLFAQGSVVSLLFAIAAVGQVRGNELRTQAALQQTRARNAVLREFRTLFDNASVGLYRADSAGRILRANPALARMQGCASGAELAERLDGHGRLWHADAATHRALLAALDRDGGIVDHEYATGDGRRLVENARLAERRPDGGFIYEGAVQDISERYRMERRLREANAATERAMADRQRLFSATNHDLRQPLQSLGLFIELAHGRARDPKVRQWLEQMRASHASLSDTIDGLLALSRLEAQAVQPDITVFALEPMLAALGAEYAVLAEARSLRMRTRGSRLHVRSDRVLVERMLRNLLGNALRYTDSGTVLLGVRRRGDRAGIQVLDTGQGIEADAQARIFDEFEQSASGRRAGAGIGLGLAIVRGLAELLGIEVRMHSIAGRGSCFELLLPLAGAGEAAAPTGTDAQCVLEGRRVLVVDDDPDVRGAFAELLRSRGADVACAAGSDEAVACARPLPDLLILDRHLADGTGEACHRRLIAEAGVCCPVLLVSAESAIPALEGHPRSVALRKPVAPDVLFGAIGRLLDAAA
ncbi:ATP-binding protein [Algiphilus sp.]|uniref:ATP-binding protein n=1 Tax=Algiphilus sp. TaxID=1872431 RepID=UPI0025B9AF08|nr:ATP-binding protein [Algiphilus sp.]MCK5771070.1 response regulator [Algiphilus sp.]